MPDGTVTAAAQDALAALLDWRAAPAGRAAERRAARMLAYRTSLLLRELRCDVDG